MDSLEAGCYALKTLRQHRQGNVVLWGWLTSGWLTKETLAQWKFEGDVEALAEIAQTEQVAPQYLQASSLAAGIRFRTCRMHKSGIGPSSYHQHAVFPSCADGVDTHSSAVLIKPARHYIHNVRCRAYRKEERSTPTGHGATLTYIRRGVARPRTLTFVPWLKLLVQLFLCRFQTLAQFS